MKLKERIQKWMDIKKIPSVNELAARSILTQSTLSNIMTGRNESANAKTIEKICDGLGVTVTEFYDLDDKEDIVSATINKAESMPKSEDEKTALERLRAMPVDEQQRRVLAEYESLTPEQRAAIDIIIRSLASSRQ